MSHRAEWANSLAKWAIPQEILAQATSTPWIHPPELFAVPDEIESTISHVRAQEALPIGGSILDIGCGGGRATFALMSASHVIGVDHQGEMLDMYAANAKSRGVKCEVFEGFWPEVAAEVPSADVVVCHHVVYNVPDIAPFLEGLNSHAKHRVVIEMPANHPLTNLSGAWKYFWNLDRPVAPIASDLVEILKEIGIEANIEYWIGKLRDRSDIDRDSEFMRVRLCLPPERLGEVREYLMKNPLPAQREIATIWWDVSALRGSN